jgi:hypothetical protein
MRAAQKSRQVRVTSGKRPSPNRGKSYMPLPQQVRVMKKYADGKSMRQIAAEEKKDEVTIARVVKSEEMQAFGKSLLEKILGRCGDKLVLRIEHEIEDWDTKNGAWVAMDLAERIGAIPPKIHRQATVVADVSGSDVVGDVTNPDTWLLRMVQLAKEKGRVFGTRLPDIEEVLTKEEREKYEAELAEEQE